MPLALAALAWLLIMTGINGNFSAVGQAFEQDVMGSNGGGFLQFLIGIIGIAVFFRVLGMPQAGKVFIGLVILVFIMKNQGVITALENVTTGSSASTASTTPAGTAAATGATASVGGLASTLANIFGSTSAAGTNAQSAVGGAVTGETSGTGSST